LDSNRPKYNQNTDIFALGCIVYEIVTGDKLFWDDFVIVNYSATGTLNESIWWPGAAEENWNCVASLENLVASMLETDLRRRPSARDVQKNLEGIRAGTSTCSGLLRSGRPIQVCLFTIFHFKYKRYLVSGPFVAEDKVLDQSRRNDHKRIPFARRAPSRPIEAPLRPTASPPLPTRHMYPDHEIVDIQSEKSISDQVTPPLSSNFHGEREGYDENERRELQPSWRRAEMVEQESP